MRLLDTRTDVVVEVPEDVACADHEDQGEYMWTEGNYGCDCNRALFHARARGVPDPEEKDLVCGEDRFVLLGAPWIDVDLVISQLRKQGFDGLHATTLD